MRVDADDFARPCSCGREHHIDVKEIIIESGVIGKLEKEMSDGDGRYLRQVSGSGPGCRGS